MTEKNDAEGYVGHFTYDGAGRLFRAEARPASADGLRADLLGRPETTPHLPSGHYFASGTAALGEPSGDRYTYMGPQPDNASGVRSAPVPFLDRAPGQPPRSEPMPPEPADGSGAG